MPQVSLVSSTARMFPAHPIQLSDYSLFSQRQIEMKWEGKERKGKDQKSLPKIPLRHIDNLVHTSSHAQDGLKLPPQLSCTGCSNPVTEMLANKWEVCESRIISSALQKVELF
jgi:hypothetical protein